MNLAATSLENLNTVSVKLAVTEPVFTRSFSGPQLLSLEQKPLPLSLPAVSVAVERGVKDVTQASLMCSDSTERDGVILQKIKSRKLNPNENRNRVISP